MGNAIREVNTYYFVCSMGWMFCGFWWRSFPSSNNVVKMYSKVTWSTSMLKLAACNFLLFKTFSRKIPQNIYDIGKILYPFKNLKYWRSYFSEELYAEEILDSSHFLSLFFPSGWKHLLQRQMKTFAFWEYCPKAFFFFLVEIQAKKPKRKSMFSHFSIFLVLCLVAVKEHR